MGFFFLPTTLAKRMELGSLEGVLVSLQFKKTPPPSSCLFCFRTVTFHNHNHNTSGLSGKNLKVMEPKPIN